jgi:cobalt-zinc-cadmium efflux system membrane fusion protein
MKRKSTIILVVMAMLGVIILTCLHKDLPAGATPDAGTLPPPDVIKTAAPELKTFTETCRWFGKVKSRNRMRIIALKAGRVVAIAAGVGASVAKGDLLFTLGGALANSRLEALKNHSAALTERFKLARQMVEIKRQAVAQQFAKHEELTSAEDTLAHLKAVRESIRQEIQRFQEATHIRATTSGVFTNCQVYVGQEVLKGDNLAEIISPDHIYIVATLFPKGGDAELEKKPTVIKLPAGNSIQGTITTILPQRTAAGATVVWIEGSNLDVALRPGQTVAGSIIIAVHKKVLAVPQAAVVRDEEEQAYIFLKDVSGFRRQPVKTGLGADGWVEILSGVTERDNVVIQGAYELFYRDFNKIYKVAD